MPRGWRGKRRRGAMRWHRFFGLEYWRRAEPGKPRKSSSEKRKVHCNPVNMPIFAVASRGRRGDLTQRSAGKELIESADRDMAGQGIRRPERFADMLAPGAAAPQIVTPFSHRNLRLDLAAVAVHRGPYNRMNEAHDAIRKWMAENCRESAGHSWEIYGDSAPDPADTRRPCTS